jgi:hypothetical protein
MRSDTEPEILAPRVKRAKSLVDDENLELLSHVLDDFIQIPGTSIRFGLDGIVGLIPGLGDVIGGIASCVIIVAAWLRGVAYVTLLRMVVNVAIEVVIGSIPLIGDAFDIAWKTNRRNYNLLTRSLIAPRKHTIQSWLFLAAILVALFFIMLIPMLIVAWLANAVMHQLFGVNLHFRTWF